MRRALSALLLALASAAPVWAAFARVEPIAAAPAPLADVAPVFAAPVSAVPVSAVPILAAPILAAQVQAEPESPAAALVQIRAAAVPALPEPAIAPDVDVRPDAVARLKAEAGRPDAAPADYGRLFDSAPDAPDFEALAPSRAPAATWRPRAALLIRLVRPRRDERVTAEELRLRESLSGLHAAIAGGRFQDAISAVSGFFQTPTASSWFLENPRYRPYRGLAFDYMRFAERAVLKAYGRARSRGADPALISEARDAASRGRIQGRAWRPTPIQEKDSGLCAQNALFNAISASVGFTRPTRIDEFVAASRAALNPAAKLDRSADPAGIAALADSLGVDFGPRDVGRGMSTRSMIEWASLLGMELAARRPPKDEAGWSALLGPGREVLLSLRMFHPAFTHSAEERAARGHDYRVLDHEVYLLGAFDSASRGERLFLLQDSGSGSTLMATAGELSALVAETQILTAAGPARVPRGR